MSSTSRKPQPLYLIVLAWLVAAAVLASGVVLATSLNQVGNGWPAVGVLLASLAGYGLVQRLGLAAAHDWADAHRTKHRESDQHRRPPSRLAPLVTPPRGLPPVRERPAAHLATGPVAIEKDITALASSIGVYVPRHGCDTDTAVIPAVSARGVR